LKAEATFEDWDEEKIRTFVGVPNRKIGKPEFISKYGFQTTIKRPLKEIYKFSKPKA
jgi:hypothetical protein